MALSILAEVRPRLKSFNISIEKDNNVLIKFKENELLVNNQIIKFSGLTFDGGNIRKLPTNNTFNAFNVKFNDFIPCNRVKYVFEPPLENDCNVTIRCFLCGYIIVDNISFKRVLPLPSSNWDATDAFCHGGKHVDNKIKMYDCLYGTHFIHISKEIVKNSEGNECPSCYETLGLTTANYLHLWVSNINFGKTVSTKDQLLAILHDIISEPLILISKILLYSCSSYVTITVMEKNLHVYRYNRKIDDENLKLDQESVLKLMYSFHSSKDDKIMEWLSDKDVHLIEVSMKLLTAINILLENSHAKIHPLFNLFDNEKFAYL